jgi:hypothetical protein
LSPSSLLVTMEISKVISTRPKKPKFKIEKISATLYLNKKYWVVEQYPWPAIAESIFWENGSLQEMCHVLTFDIGHKT